MVRLDIYANPNFRTYVFFVCPKTRETLGYAEVGVSGVFEWNVRGASLHTRVVGESFWDSHGSLDSLIRQIPNTTKVGFLDLDTGKAYMDGKYPVNSGEDSR